jgi:hypothetical protein
MLGHLTGAKMAAIATIMKKNTNHGMLTGEHSGASRGLDTIVEKGECLQISTSFVACF